MRVFVDVGAHYGETLDVALNPQWGFDRVYSLEPSRPCFDVLSRFRDSRLRVEQIGLSNRSNYETLHGSGLLGGSIYADKTQLTDDLPTELIKLVRARDWLNGIPGEIYLKMNCEGSEVDILADLLDSGQISRIKSIYVAFDISKVPGQEWREKEIEDQLRSAGIRYVSTSGRNTGGNSAVEQWLERDCPKVPTSRASRLSHTLRLYAPLYDRAVHLLKLILPRKTFWWLGRNFGRIARQSPPSKSRS